ncbi:MAG: hypothetical protein IPG72_04495 [Ardenticatenales bacterium]|nr:hypothetical protein [Ardenticatenales bacterium]
MSASTGLKAAKVRLFGCELSPTDTRNMRRFSAWCMAWAVAFVAAIFAFERGAAPGSPVAWLLVAVPTLVGLQTIRAYLHFLREADELQRRIQFEALAFGFCVGVVCMMSYRLLERAGWPKLDINDTFVVMMFGWAFGMIRGARRYS